MFRLTTKLGQAARRDREPSAAHGRRLARAARPATRRPHRRTAQPSVAARPQVDARSRARAARGADRRRQPHPDHAALRVRARLAHGGASRPPRRRSARGSTPAAGHGTATLSNGRGGGPNPVTALCRRHGLWGKGSREKHVPRGDLRARARADRALPRRPLRLRRSHPRLRAGSARSATRRSASGSRAMSSTSCCGSTASPRSGRSSAPSTTGPRTVAREVLITGQADLDAFAAKVPVVGKQHQLRRVFEHLAAHRFKTYVDTRARRGVGAGARRQGRAQLGDRQRGRRPSAQPQLARRHARPLATPARPPRHGARRLPAGRPRRRRTSGGTRSCSIEPLGEQETYDLTVPGDHNFVATT